MNISQNCYAENDHLALEFDLQHISERRIRIIPLSKVVDWHRGLIPDEEVSNCVAITLDDGSWFDYYDVQHPKLGVQRSMFNILRAFQERKGNAYPVYASSFVISSPDARTQLDRTCMIGRGWWGDEWWREANSSGLLTVECHSWDHLHPTLETVEQKDNIKADFREVRSYEDCATQVVEAAEYIEQRSGNRPNFFAYPWGQASEYLTQEFMPNYKNIHRFQAAFSIEPKPVEKEDNVWILPRFVCGRDWNSPTEFKALIASV